MSPRKSEPRICARSWTKPVVLNFDIFRPLLHKLFLLGGTPAENHCCATTAVLALPEIEGHEATAAPLKGSCDASVENTELDDPRSLFLFSDPTYISAKGEGGQLLQ